MKSSLIASFFLFALSTSAQTSVTKNNIYASNNGTRYIVTVVSERKATGPEPERIACVSTNRDTLWLIDDQIGYLIAATWDNDPLPDIKKPVIIFTSEVPAPPSTSTTSSKRKRGKRIRTGQASLSSH